MTEKTNNNDEPQQVVPRLLFSSRLNTSLMCLIASFCSLIMTINLGMAIVCMNSKQSIPSNGSETADGICNATDSGDTDAPSTCLISQEDVVVWDKETQGLLLGATYYGTVAIQLPVGWLSDKFGRAKLQMLIGNGVMGCLSLLSPVLIQHAGVPYYLTARIIIGMGLGLSVSSILPLLGRWTTPREQGLLVGLSFAGVGLASTLTYPISGLLCEYGGGWKTIFYFSGACALVWSIAAIFLVYDGPMVHPRVSQEEKEYILSFHPKGQPKKKKKVVIPWKSLLLSVPVWSVVVTNFFFFAAQKGTVINLPIYIRDVLDFTITENGVFSALPSALALILHLIVGPLFDCARARKACTVTTVRKIFHAFGTLIPAGMMFAASQLDPEQKYVIISLITVGYAFYEVAWVGGFAFCMLDMAPDYVGVLQGINNTIGLTPGFIMPVIVSLMTPNGTREEWSYVFIMFGGMYSVAALTWLIFGSSALQTWGRAKVTEDEPQTEKLIVNS